jgi:hypothetical protein
VTSHSPSILANQAITCFRPINVVGQFRISVRLQMGSHSRPDCCLRSHQRNMFACFRRNLIGGFSSPQKTQPSRILSTSTRPLCSFYQYPVTLIPKYPSIIQAHTTSQSRINQTISNLSGLYLIILSLNIYDPEQAPNSPTTLELWVFAFVSLKRNRQLIYEMIIPFRISHIYFSELFQDTSLYLINFGN